MRVENIRLSCQNETPPSTPDFPGTPRSSGRPAPLLLLLPFLLLSVCVLTGCDKSSPRIANDRSTVDVTISSKRFHLELAADQQTRYQGLSDRESIPPDGGMLFVFPQKRELYFVMRRCLVPIDIIFLAPDGRIVSMHQMQVEPIDRSEKQLKQYPSGWKAQFAVELAGGTLDKLDLKIGQKINLPAQDLKQIVR